MVLYIIIAAFVIFWIIGKIILPIFEQTKTEKQQKNNDGLLVEFQPIRTSIEFAGTIQNVDNSNTVQSGGEISEVQDVNSIVFQDGLGQQLSFNKVQGVISPEVTFREVTYSMPDNVAKIIQMAMPAGQQLYTANALAQMAPNGLFTATVNPIQLSHFLKDGTYTTMIHGNGGVVTHAGFQKVPGLGGFNPVVIMTVAFQAMAMISGNHYMHSINQKLETIEKGIQEIMAYNTDKDIGILNYAHQTLTRITTHRIIPDSDMEEIREIKRNAGTLYEQYKLMYAQQLESTKNYQAAKESVDKRLNAYYTEVHKFETTAKICAYAYQIWLQAAWMEICASMMRDVQKAEIQNMISDAVNICRSHFEKSNVSYKWIETNAMKILEEKTFKEKLFPNQINEDKKHELLCSAEQINNDLNSIIRQAVKTENTERVILNIQDDRQMLLIPGESGSQPRIFIPMAV